LHEVCAIPAKTRFRGDALWRLLRHYGGSMNPDFRMVPLFADLDDAQLEILIGATQRRKLPAGHVLFEKGAVADCWFLLVEGAISVRDEDGERFLVRATATVGELSVFTEEERRLSAVVVEPSVVLFLPRADLQKLLEQNGALAFGLMRGLLRLTGRKIGRDQRRLREMRENIVSTQKAMKRMQEFLLEGEDNPLHAALFEELDALVEQNKRWHYLVEPSRLVPTEVRLDGGPTLRVGAISNEWLHFEKPANVTLTAGQDFSCVLLLDGAELPVSGTIERVSESEVVVFLDEMIPEYDRKLADHLARAQMLDIVL
jgi:CRP-like cAMP-binding protein